jgi:hypothetical protein
MKLYQSRYHEILINEGVINEERFMDQYRYILEDCLSIHAISTKKFYECINLKTGNVVSKPLVIETLLRKGELPAFKFLVSKN